MMARFYCKKYQIFLKPTNKYGFFLDESQKEHYCITKQGKRKKKLCSKLIVI
jgi:hypothetical protein